jgi:hypothetical protein
MPRQKAVIDFDRVAELLRAHASGVSIARVLGVSRITLYKAVEQKYKCKFTDFVKEMKEEGVALVKESMYKDALAGAHGGIDRIFWLKNNAGWSDKRETTHEGLPPTIQIALAPNVDSKMSKKIEQFFNGIIDDNNSIREELPSISERSETDNQSGGAGIE